MPNKSGYKPSMTEAIRANHCVCLCNFGSITRNHDCGGTSCPIYKTRKVNVRQVKPNWLFRIFRSIAMESVITKTTELQAFYRTFINVSRVVGKTKLIRATCIKCMGYNSDGRHDCEIQGCPLYFWMPYRELEPTFDWMFDLSYTTKHKMRMVELGIKTREEYIERTLSYHPGKNEVDEDESEEVEEESD